MREIGLRLDRTALNDDEARIDDLADAAIGDWKMQRIKRRRLSLRKTSLRF